MENENCVMLLRLFLVVFRHDKATLREGLSVGPFIFVCFCFFLSSLLFIDNAVLIAQLGELLRRDKYSNQKSKDQKTHQRVVFTICLLTND